jgi:hypothetical protein
LADSDTTERSADPESSAKKKRAPRSRTKPAGKAPEAPSLLEANIVDIEKQQPAATQRAFVPLNHYNVVSSLASGLVRPRGGFRKYYADLLELLPAGVPIIMDSIDSVAVSIITTEAAARPMLIEISPAYVSSLPIRLETDGRIIAALAEDGIPLTLATALIFRTDQDRDEVFAREYDGVDYSALPSSVEPTLFAGSESPWLEQMQQTVHGQEPLTKEQFTLVDRIAGGVAVALKSLTNIAANPDDVGALVGASLPGSPSGTKRIIPLQWPASTDSVDDIESALFYSAITILRSVDREDAWDPTTVLKRIVDEFTANYSPPAETLEMLREIWRVLRLESSPRNFSDMIGAATANALEWILAEPDPESLSHPPQNIDPTDEVVFRAAILSGSLNGFELLSSSMRVPGMTGFIGNLQCNLIRELRTKRSLHESLIGPIDLSVSGMWRLRLDSVHGLEGKVLEPPIKSVVDDTAELVGSVADCRRRGWLDCIISELRIAKGSDVFFTSDEAGVTFRVSSAIEVFESVSSEKYAARVKADRANL